MTGISWYNTELVVDTKAFHLVAKKGAIFICLWWETVWNVTYRARKMESKLRMYGGYSFKDVDAGATSFFYKIVAIKGTDLTQYKREGRPLNMNGTACRGRKAVF